MNLFTPSLTGTEGSWIAEKKKNVSMQKRNGAALCKRIHAAIKQFNDWYVSGKNQ